MSYGHMAHGPNKTSENKSLAFCPCYILKLNNFNPHHPQPPNKRIQRLNMGLWAQNLTPIPHTPHIYTCFIHTAMHYPNHMRPPTVCPYSIGTIILVGFLISKFTARILPCGGVPASKSRRMPKPLWTSGTDIRRGVLSGCLPLDGRAGGITIQRSHLKLGGFEHGAGT